MHETCPATEPQLADFPATQLVCAATALDLMMLQTTQVETADAGAAAACQPKLTVHFDAHHALHHASEPALGVKHPEGIEPTPVLQIAALQDSEAASHGRAPAGPMTSPAQRYDTTHSKEAAQAAALHTSRGPTASDVADDTTPAARNSHPLASVINPADTAGQMLPESQAERLVDSAKPYRYKPEHAVAVRPGTAPSMDPSSLATGMDTANASLSQVDILFCVSVPLPAHWLLDVLSNAHHCEVANGNARGGCCLALPCCT